MPGAAELVEDGVTGLLFEPGDAVALAAQMKKKFEGDLGSARELKLESWRQRPGLDKLRERAGGGRTAHWLHRSAGWEPPRALRLSRLPYGTTLSILEAVGRRETTAWDVQP